MDGAGFLWAEDGSGAYGRCSPSATIANLHHHLRRDHQSSPSTSPTTTHHSTVPIITIMAIITNAVINNLVNHPHQHHHPQGALLVKQKRGINLTSGPSQKTSVNTKWRGEEVGCRTPDRFLAHHNQRGTMKRSLGLNRAMVAFGRRAQEGRTNNPLRYHGPLAASVIHWGTTTHNKNISWRGLGHTMKPKPTSPSSSQPPPSPCIHIIIIVIITHSCHRPWEQREAVSEFTPPTN